MSDWNLGQREPTGLEYVEEVPWWVRFKVHGEQDKRGSRLTYELRRKMEVGAAEGEGQEGVIARDARSLADARTAFGGDPSLRPPRGLARLLSRGAVFRGGEWQLPD